MNHVFVKVSQSEKTLAVRKGMDQGMGVMVTDVVHRLKNRGKYGLLDKIAKKA